MQLKKFIVSQANRLFPTFFFRSMYLAELLLEIIHNLKQDFPPVTCEYREKLFFCYNLEVALGGERLLLRMLDGARHIFLCTELLKDLIEENANN